MERGMKKKNYYELLGVSVDSDSQQIKEAYRKLQKKYHPDIAGNQGHEYTLMLNKAYKVLMRAEVRKEYDASIGQSQVGFGRQNSSLGFSSWKGPLRPQALFVDQNACIESACTMLVIHSPWMNHLAALVLNFNSETMTQISRCRWNRVR
jgi:curved DNA-binding protein CbpA